MQIAITGKDLNLATLDSNEAKRPGLQFGSTAFRPEKNIFLVYSALALRRLSNQKTNAPDGRPKEKIEIDNRQAEDQRVIDEAIRKKREQATQRAASMWDSVATQHSVAADHPYVQKKKIKPAGARQLGGSILIPLNKFTDSGTALVGLQTIAEAEEDDGSKSISKKFLYGSETKGSWALIGQISEKTEIVYLCEGWATGCSVYEAIKLPVVVAFSAGNLEPVLTEFKKKYPDIFFIIAADNDCHYADRLQGRRQIPSEL